MRVPGYVGSFVAILASACASRSPLHGKTRADASVADASAEAPPQDAGVFIDTAPIVRPDTWSFETGGTTCLARPTACLKGSDFGPNIAVTAVFNECIASVGKACGELHLVFDAEGCLGAITDISEFSPAFVACVERVVNGTRWECAVGKNVGMVEACTP